MFVGIGFYLDGIITSSLKTPLQRLSIKIESADIDEKIPVKFEEGANITPETFEQHGEKKEWEVNLRRG